MPVHDSENLPATIEPTPVAITMPAKVRRFLQSAAPGQRCELFRNNVSAGHVDVESAGALVRAVRDAVVQSTVDDGPGIWTILIDDAEEIWDPQIHDTGRDDYLDPDGPARAWRRFSERLEASLYRSIDANTRVVESIADTVEQIGRATNALAKMHRKHDPEVDPEVVKAQVEADAEAARTNQLLAGLQMMLGKFTTNESGAMAKVGEKPGLVTQVFNVLDETERNAVLATDEGLVFHNATDDTTARVALRALGDLITRGKIKLRPETLQLAASLFGGQSDGASSKA